MSARLPAPETQSVLTCSGLTVGYGGAPVLTGVSLDLALNSVIGLLGRNGAGKTTLLEALAGVHRLTAGQITLLGQDITALGAPRRVRRHIALVPQGRRIIVGMSVRENLLAGAHTIPRRLVAQRLDLVRELFPVLAKWMAKDGVSLSGGQQQVVAIARAVMSDPQVLLLDEPFTGLSPVMVDEVCETIARTKHAGASVIVAEQNARAAVGIADDVLVISGGAIQSVPPGELGARLAHIQEIFFGVDAERRIQQLAGTNGEQTNREEGTRR